MSSDDEIDFVALSHWLSRCRPMPTRRKVLPFRYAFTAEEVGALRRGLLVPGDMDQRWFGVLREGSLDFYRSWTGFHIYCLYLRNEGRALVAHKLVVSRGRRQYFNTDDGYDCEIVGLLIKQMLRGH